MNTRSNLDLHTTPISELQYESSRQQVKSELPIHSNAIETMSTINSVDESDNNIKKQAASFVNWEEIRETEQQRLKLIKVLTKDEMINIDQWLTTLSNRYDELCYPELLRVHHAITYFQEEEKLWYEQEKIEINGNWLCFCKKLRQHVKDCMKPYNDKSLNDQPLSSFNAMSELEQVIRNNFITYSGTSDARNWLLQTINQFKHSQLSRLDQIQAIPFLLEGSAYLWYIDNEQLITNFESFCKLFLQKFASNIHSSFDNALSFTSQLCVTMAAEIIRNPTYFHGSKDDVLDWLEKIEQRFTVANWDDENKLKYISIHLKDDALRWWINTSHKITSWSNFVTEVKNAFGSTKMKELAFEQLKWYKQSIHQSITQYYDKVIELCKRINPIMPDSMKLQYLKAGVKDSLKLHIALHDPQDTVSFLSYARKLEDTLSFTDVSREMTPSEEQRNIIEAQQRPSVLNTFQKQQKDYRQIPAQHLNLQVSQPNNNNKTQNRLISPSDRFRHISSKRSLIICYRCGTPGHYARECTQPHFD